MGKGGETEMGEGIGEGRKRRRGGGWEGDGERWVSR